MMKLCDYGCGKEAIYQFKNGKFCCSKSTSKCPKMKIINGDANRGRKHREQTKRKISESNKLSQIGNKNALKYGCEYYLHETAWKLFGKDVCSLCGMTNEEHIVKYNCRLNMHCASNPKNYHLLEEDNWETYCKECHGKLDNGNI